MHTKSLSLPDLKIFHMTMPKIVDGRLLVKEETFIAPLSRPFKSTTTESSAENTIENPTESPFGTLSSRAAYVFNDLTRPFHGAFLCPHLEWCHLGVELIRGTVNDSTKTKDMINPFIADHRYAAAHLDYDNESIRSGDPRCRARLHCPATGPGNQAHIPACYSATDPVPAEILETVPDPAITCALLHAQPCARTECLEMATPRRIFNLVRSCALCATDVCVGVQDDMGEVEGKEEDDEDGQAESDGKEEGKETGKESDKDKGKTKGKRKATNIATNQKGFGRIITLTTWKDLGGVYENQWASWDSHYAHVLLLGLAFQNADKVYREMIGRDRDGVARVYGAFEGVEVDREGEADQLDFAFPSFYQATVTPQIRRRWTEGAQRDGEDSWVFAVPFFSERYL
ncbi:hypothetical protein B0J18DRAFT_425371 [Chaetomium sp. MPI-SDFR-AT-0129]|nr:hypothetical protein B0J18DRAFT_425371 [Chaetomium sp. MPI-SDFR-AT-0129]